MAQYGNAPVFRKSLLDQLQKRNNRECKAFEEIIGFNNKLFLTVDNLKSENVQLSIQKEKLQQENIELRQCGESGGGAKGNSSTNVLEKKIFQLQDEVAELLRRRSEHAQQLLDIKTLLDEKEKELIATKLKLQETEVALANVTDKTKRLEKEMNELRCTAQILRDEHEALQLAFTSLEEKNLKLEKEHQELVSRWIALKNRDVERLNAENEQERKIRQMKMQKELEDAAREQPVIIEKSDIFKYVPICVAASLPNKAIQKIDAHDGEVNAVVWSPTGKLVATGGGDRKVKLWEVNHGEIILKSNLTGCSGSVMSVDFDLEETLVIGGSCDYASRIWTVSDGRLRHTLTGHGGKVFTAKFLNEPSKVMTGSHDRTLKLWDLRSRACIKTIFAGSSCFDLVSSDAAGTTIISAHFDKKLRYWDTRSELNTCELLLNARATSLQISPDKMFLLVCLREDCLKLVDLRLNNVVKTFCHENFKVGCDWTKARFSPDGNYVTAGSSDGTIYIWEVETGKVEKTLKEHDAIVTGCAWDPKGTQLITADMNHKLVLWGEF